MVFDKVETALEKHNANPVRSRGRAARPVQCRNRSRRSPSCRSFRHAE